MLCMEYETFNMNDAKCMLWQDVIDEVCVGGCGDCSIMEETIYDSCRFALSDIGSDTLTIKYCQETQEQFRIGHC